MGKAKKNITMTIRLTEPEKQDIEFCAEHLGVTQTEVICKGAGLVRQMIEKYLREHQPAAGLKE